MKNETMYIINQTIFCSSFLSYFLEFSIIFQYALVSIQKKTLCRKFKWHLGRSGGWCDVVYKGLIIYFRYFGLWILRKNTRLLWKYLTKYLTKYLKKYWTSMKILDKILDFYKILGKILDFYEIWICGMTGGFPIKIGTQMSLFITYSLAIFIA